MVRNIASLFLVVALFSPGLKPKHRSVGVGVPAGICRSSGSSSMKSGLDHERRRRRRRHGPALEDPGGSQPRLLQRFVVVKVSGGDRHQPRTKPSGEEKKTDIIIIFLAASDDFITPPWSIPVIYLKFTTPQLCNPRCKCQSLHELCLLFISPLR